MEDLEDLAKHKADKGAWWMARCWWNVLVQRHGFSILVLLLLAPAVFDSYIQENDFLG